jgi:hypothetical protein
MRKRQAKKAIKAHMRTIRHIRCSADWLYELYTKALQDCVDDDYPRWRSSPKWNTLFHNGT